MRMAGIWACRAGHETRIRLQRFVHVLPCHPAERLIIRSADSDSGHIFSSFNAGLTAGVCFPPDHRVVHSLILRRPLSGVSWWTSWVSLEIRTSHGGSSHADQNTSQADNMPSTSLS